MLKLHRSAPLAMRHLALGQRVVVNTGAGGHRQIDLARFSRVVIFGAGHFSEKSAAEFRVLNKRWLRGWGEVSLVRRLDVIRARGVVRAAYVATRALQGSEPCPVCGIGRLVWARGKAGELHGRCTRVRCVSFRGNTKSNTKSDSRGRGGG